MIRTFLVASFLFVTFSVFASQSESTLFDSFNFSAGSGTPTVMTVWAKPNKAAALMGKGVKSIRVDVGHYFDTPYHYWTCELQLQSINIKYDQGQKLVSYSAMAGTWVNIAEPVIEEIQYVFYDPQRIGSRCSVKSYAATDGPIDPPTEEPAIPLYEFSILDKVDFLGGFIKGLSLPVQSKERFSHLRFEFAKSCPDTIDILEVGTTSESYYDVAKPIDQKYHIYEIDRGQGVRIGSVQLSLNGPKLEPEKSCGIFVFGRTVK